MALAYRPALRSTHPHLLSCRIRSSHYYRKWYVPPRNRGRQSLHIARWPPPPTLGRPHSARDAGKATDCLPTRPHSALWPPPRSAPHRIWFPNLHRIRESKQINVSQSVSHHTFLSDSHPSDALQQCFTACFACRACKFSTPKTRV